MTIRCFKCAGRLKLFRQAGQPITKAGRIKYYCQGCGRVQWVRLVQRKGWPV